MIQGRAGIVKWPCAIAFGLAGLIGAMFGTELAKQIDGNTLIKWFALAMIAIAATMALPRKSEGDPTIRLTLPMIRSEEHTSELQSLMRISYAVFCLKKKNKKNKNKKDTIIHNNTNRKSK